MKSFFKRSAISVIVLGMAGSIHAAMPNNTTTWSTPQFSGAFIGVEGLYLRPMNGDLDYVTVFPNNAGGAFSTQSIDTSYDWSWRVYGGLKFTENDDLTVSWMRMRTSDNDSVSPAGTIPPDNVGVSFPRWLDSFPWKNVSGKVTFDLDDAYAVWGHTINFNNPWSVRFGAGVEYAKITSDLTVTADAGNFPGPALDHPTAGFQSNSQLKGFGPRVEFDMTYHLPYGFALFSNANAALLVSTRDISLDPVVSTFGEDGEDFNFFSSNYSDRHVVVPKVGLRLGASYTYVWGQAGGEGACRTTSLTIDAGWQAESYIHAIERPNDSSFFDVATTLVQSSSSGSSTSTSNFGDQGLFVGIKVGTDWL